AAEVGSSRAVLGTTAPLCVNAEHVARALDTSYQRIDVGFGVVHIERRPRGRRHVQAPHQRLRTMMARANADADLVENRREIVRMDLRDREADHSAPVRRWRTVNPY